MPGESFEQVLLICPGVDLVTDAMWWQNYFSQALTDWTVNFERANQTAADYSIFHQRGLRHSSHQPRFHVVTSIGFLSSISLIHVKWIRPHLQVVISSGFHILNTQKQVK